MFLYFLGAILRQAIHPLARLTWPNHPCAAPAVGKLCHSLETCQLEVRIQKTQVVVILDACGDPSAKLWRFRMETEMQMEPNLYPIAPSRSPKNIQKYRVISYVATALCFLTFSFNHKYQNAGQTNCEVGKKYPKRTKETNLGMFHHCELQLQLRLRERIGSEPQRWSYTPNVQRLAPEEKWTNGEQNDKKRETKLGWTPAGMSVLGS